MRILVLSDEVWNDIINGNNITSNWFEGMNAEFANIYASPGVPYNQCCNRYFQITDMMMLKSIVSNKKAGKILTGFNNQGEIPAEKEPKKIYKFLKAISGSWLRLVREMLWSLGKYDIEEMKRFLNEFQPDVIFSERRATCKMLRLETVVHNLYAAPMFAFTGDDEYSLKQFSISPFFWVNRFAVRKRLKQNVKRYEVYYTLSEEQKEYYERLFGCRCKLLYKCGNPKDFYQERLVHFPIKMIYAGKFYCNRWKILSKIANILQDINSDEVKVVLEIYTKDSINKKQNRLLNDGRSTVIRGPVSQEELRRIYEDADIALHVESDDLKYRLATRFSFSTKIVDCLLSGCAVLAYCWNQHSGFTYLAKEDAAICVSSEAELRKALYAICDNTKIIHDYAYKAFQCAKRNHIRNNTQEMLQNDFNSVCSQKV